MLARKFGEPCFVRDLSVLSDVEFEELAADLLAADYSVTVERFAKGADGGVDLRWTNLEGSVEIGQCKHYSRSTFAQLLAAARAEVNHLAQLEPTRYVFVTSQDLTPGQKKQIAEALAPWLASPTDVIASRDVDGLITRFPRVEQAHPKLWLSSGTQLFWATHSDIASRASALRHRIDAALPRYVTNESFSAATRILNEERACIIAGLPGIGKTTLAHALIANAMSEGYEPVEVSADISEAWTAFQPDVPQAFLYDDFLGQLTFSERLGKNEDRRLVDFVEKVRSTKTKLLVLTTREYILQDARRVYRRLSDLDERAHLVLQLSDYTRMDRARILYNHLWQAAIPPHALAEISADGCLRVVDHPNYSPRLIEFCTGSAFDRSSPGYVDRFVASLDHPEQLWRTALEDHLSESQRLVLVALASLPAQADLDDLSRAHGTLCASRSVPTSAADFRNGLQVLEGTFLSVEMVYGVSKVAFHNPSVRAFMLDWIAMDAGLVRDLIDSAAFFEQVSTLYTFATGRGARAMAAEPSASLLANAVYDHQSRLTSALVKLVDSPTPARGGMYLSDVNTPIASRLEDRLMFLVRLPVPFMPPADWVAEQLEAAAERWSMDQGSKRRAAELVEELEPVVGEWLPMDRFERISATLDAWLERRLDDTDEDWLPYLRRLKDVHGVNLSHAKSVAEKFEEHVANELTRWSPSPPQLEELLEYAKEFELDYAVEQLEEKAREDEARDGRGVDTKGLGSAGMPAGNSKRASDEEVQQLFRRLAPAERRDEQSA